MSEQELDVVKLEKRSIALNGKFEELITEQKAFIIGMRNTPLASVADAETLAFNKGILHGLVYQYHELWQAFSDILSPILTKERRFVDIHEVFKKRERSETECQNE